MAAEPPALPVALLDANVLYPQFLRDVMLRLAASDLYRPRWSDEIENEWKRNVAGDHKSIPATKLDETAALMNRCFPDARVGEFHQNLDRFPNVDPKDRHVAAAALAANATHLVTWNIKDFPKADLAAFGIRRVTPAQFVRGLIADDPETARRILERHRTGLNRPAMTSREYRNAMIRAGLSQFARLLEG